jgi:hypothetical protein
MNAIGQSAQIILGSNLTNDDSAQDLQNFVQVLAMDLLTRGMQGGISYFEEAPMWYRELFEAFFPTTVKGNWQAQYRFDVTTLPNGYNPTDGVQWGNISAPTANLNGLLAVGAFAPSTDITTLVNSANTIFQKFYAVGHKKWTRGYPDTVFKNDPSVYCFPRYDAVLDFQSGSGTTGLEVPIRTTWLAGLQLVSLTAPTGNRASNFNIPFYAPPQSYMGYRISSFHTGKQGAKNQVRLQRVDLADIMVFVWGVLSGITQQSSASTINPITVPGLNGPYDMLEVYIRLVCAIAFFNESPVTIGCQDVYGTYTPLPWGNQFLMPAADTTGAYTVFRLVAENLRRLKYVGQKHYGVPTYLFTVPMSSQADVPYKIWTQTAFPTAFNWQSMSYAGTYYNYNESGISTTGSFGLFVSNYLGTYIPAWSNYTKFAITSAQTEVGANGEKTPVQQLSWFARCIPPLTTSRRSKTVQNNNNDWEDVGSTPPSAKLVQTPFLGANAGTMCRRPYRAQQAPWLLFVLPSAYFDNGQASVNNGLSLPMNRGMGILVMPANTGTTPYYQKLLTTATSQTYTLGAATSAINELTKVLDNNDDHGLGGALGSLVNLIGQKVAKKHPKLGSFIEGAAPALDDVIGMTRFGGLNNEIGMLIPNRKGNATMIKCP